MKPYLIIGVGNLLRTDDGVGVHAVNLLNDSGKLPEWVEAVDAGTCAGDLPGLIRGREKVIIIDALEADEEPGSIFKLSASNLAPSPGSRLTLHESGVHEALQNLAMLGEHPDVEVIAVAGRDCTSMGMALSPEVQAALPRVIEAVLTSVQRYTNQKKPGRLTTAAKEGAKHQ